MTTQSKPQAETPRVSEATLCIQCDHLHSDRKRHPAYWMCSMFPRLEGFGFVTADQWDGFPPYMYAHHINGGACPLFTPIKEGNNAPESATR